jgi:cytochrome bd-type quinol oxidase subunit 1
MIPAGIISVVLAGIITYLALSKNTSRGVRIAAIIALALVGAAIIACSIILVFVLGSSGTGVEEITRELPVVPETNARSDLIPIIIFCVIIVLFISLTIIISLRGEKHGRHSKNDRPHPAKA